VSPNIAGRETVLRALILDFDGVIVESNEVKTEAFQEFFSMYPAHSALMMEYHHQNVSVTRFAKFDYLLDKLGKNNDESLRAEMAEKFSLLVSKRMLEVPLVRGAKMFLENLASRIPMYLASVTPEKELEEILVSRDLLHWFQDFYGCPPWTKADAILDILKREDITANQALLVGDSAGDQQAAQETGVRFLARDSGLPFDEPTPRKFPDMRDLAEYLTQSLA